MFVVGSQRGFSALELLVIVVIVCVVAALGMPALHSGAKVSVLDANYQGLGSVVKEYVALGYSAEYRQSGQGDPEVHLSNRLEQSLGAGGNAGYVNPFVGRQKGIVVLNSATAPSDPRVSPPAVFITDSLECQYLTFNDLPETSRRLLVGTLVVAFNAEAHMVEVFYVDGEGRKSTDVVSVPTS